MPLAITKGGFTTNTVTGNQVVAHGNALTPKLILFITGGSGNLDVDSLGRFLLGAGVSASKEFCVTSSASQGAVTTASAAACSDIACIWLVNPAAVTQVKASMVSIDATNFTINIDETDGVGRIVHWIALAGTNLEADVFSVLVPAGTGNTNIATTVTNPGFAMFCTVGGTVLGDISGSNWKIDIGMAASPLKRGAIATFSDSGETDTNSSRWQRTDRCLVSVGASETAQSEYDLASFSPSIVTLNRIVNPFDRRVLGLVLGGAQFDVHSFNQSVNTGNQSITGVGFRPAFNMFMSIGAAANTSAMATNVASVGWAISPTIREALGWREADAQPISSGLTGFNNTKCIRHIAGTTTVAVIADADFVSQDINGYTINNVTVDATSRQVIGFSIGDVKPGASHGGSHATGVKAATMTQPGVAHAESHSAAQPDSDATTSGASHGASHSTGVVESTDTKSGSSHSEAGAIGVRLSGNATDDTVVDPVDLPGDIFKTFQDAQQRHWTASVVSKVVSLSPGNNVLQAVSDTAPLPVIRRKADGTEVMNTSLVDGSTFAANVTPGVPFMALEATAIPNLLDPGEVGPARMTNRDVNVVLTDASGTALGTAANPISVDPAGVGVQSVSDGGGSITVDTAGGPLTVAGSGLVASGTLTANAGTGPFPIAGIAAHGTPVSGNPVLMGMEARTADPSAVASGSAVKTYADSLGKDVALLGAPHDLYGSGFVNLTTNVASNVLAAAGVGQRWVVTSVLVTNAHPTVGTKVEIRDGTTVRERGNAGPIDGGWSDDGNVLFIGSVNAAISARCLVSGADVDVSISGYRISN